MKRLHVNLSVNDLESSMQFYAALFDAEPTVVKEDYAKWMLDDPRVNFAITTRGDRKGVDHLGIQVESDTELDEVHHRLATAAAPVIDQGETICCYARSDKHWAFDPEGLAWETFRTLGESPVYGGGESDSRDKGSACCSRPAAGDDGATGERADAGEGVRAAGCCV
ncbi:MAG: glyoxalase/bleomycin resistance/dioxygenase family protein [Proteobacteria bacterium]|nr:MAG: glyoxalase/bleomycin resistance/dioxygenase family protein [Pseudomonadota bacterium]